MTGDDVDESTEPTKKPRGGAHARELDLLEQGEGLLSPLERFQIRFIRKSMENPAFDGSLRWLQRIIGSTWIEHSVKHLRHVYGEDRLPDLDPNKSYLCVSNHRSFFDLYVITAYLVKRGKLPHRIFFPVRSNFFYDNPLGFAVNGIMSFFAMYPPVFRERSRQALNLAGIDEVARMLRGGGVFVGVHPEGTRKKDDDPYTFLPAQSGVGRMIYRARATVLPVFIHGLTNDIVEQVSSNATKRGETINVVFGAPIDFGDLLDAPPSPRLFKKIADRSLEEVGKLGEEERAIRAGNHSA